MEIVLNQDDIEQAIRIYVHEKLSPVGLPGYFQWNFLHGEDSIMGIDLSLTITLGDSPIDDES